MGTNGNSHKAGLTWRKSSASLEHGNCVELARTGGEFGIRDSKNASGPVLHLTLDIMVFLAAMKANGTEWSS